MAETKSPPPDTVECQDYTGWWLLEETDADPFLESVLRKENDKFLLDMSQYSAVLFNYSGSFVNDSYANWKAATDAMQDIGMVAERRDALTYTNWRLHMSSTIDGFLFSVCPSLVTADRSQWFGGRRELYHSAYKQRRLEQQKHISFAPGINAFIDKLEMFDIPWYIKVSNDLGGTQNVIDELTLLSSFTYVSMRSLSSRVLSTVKATQEKFERLCKERPTVDNRVMDRLIQCASVEYTMCNMETAFKRLQRSTNLTHDTILWIVDNAVDYDIARYLKIPCVIAPWGSCDHRQMVTRFGADATVIDGIRGYFSMLQN